MLEKNDVYSCSSYNYSELHTILFLQSQTRPFSKLHYSLMKTLTMMIGEFETDSLLYSVPSILLFPLTTYGLWIIFVLVMSILLQNLLVYMHAVEPI